MLKLWFSHLGNQFKVTIPTAWGHRGECNMEWRQDAAGNHRPETFRWVAGNPWSLVVGKPLDMGYGMRDYWSILRCGETRNQLQPTIPNGNIHQYSCSMYCQQSCWIQSRDRWLVLFQRKPSKTQGNHVVAAAPAGLASRIAATFGSQIDGLGMWEHVAGKVWTWNRDGCWDETHLKWWTFQLISIAKLL